MKKKIKLQLSNCWLRVTIRWMLLRRAIVYALRWLGYVITFQPNLAKLMFYGLSQNIRRFISGKPFAQRK